LFILGITEDIITQTVAHLNAVPSLVALVGPVYNHVPQATPLPVCRVRYCQARDFTTKDSFGYDGTIQVDVFTSHRGDKIALRAIGLVVQALHLQTLTITTAQSLLLRRESVDAFTEPDGITHHAVARFRHLATT
jgi:hypothetical protein